MMYYGKLHFFSENGHVLYCSGDFDDGSSGSLAAPIKAWQDTNMETSGNGHHFPYPAASRTVPLNKNKTLLGTFKILIVDNTAN